MDGTRHPFGLSMPDRWHLDRENVKAQKNYCRATYHGQAIEFKQQFYPCLQTSQEQVQLEPSCLPDPNYDNRTHMFMSPEPTFPHGQLNGLHMFQGALPIGGHYGSYPVICSSQIMPFHQQPMMYDHQRMTPYIMPSTRSPDVRNISANGDIYLGGAHNGYNSEESGYPPKHNSEYLHQVVAPPMPYPQTPYKHGQENCVPVTCSGNSFSSLSHNQFYSNEPQPIKTKQTVDHHMDIIHETAHGFVNAFCPLLGERPYCLPPVKRCRHPDKSSKQLVFGMESEKRVLGSFERFFAENQIPVFMLCHYPVSGFMQVYRNWMEQLDFDSATTTSKNGKDTMTLLLLSHKFSVTIVTISITSGNSDFPYIQKGVYKAATHMKRCTTTVAKWLNFLGVNPEIRPVIAFPNLKRVVMQRICKDKQFQQNFGPLSTLHVDDLSAPFEEEWSTTEHKHLFSEWMQRKILCHDPTLSREDLHLVVGALLSPRLSKVPFVRDEKAIAPISTSYSVTSEDVNKEVSQLKLTIDGITKSFDEFMNEYIDCYYPNVENKTYRVPPIHFNIQSLTKAREYLHALQEKDSSAKNFTIAALENRNNSIENHFSTSVPKVGGSGESKNSNHRSETNNITSPFMPTYCSVQMSAKKNCNCSDNVGPWELDIPHCNNVGSRELETSHCDNGRISRYMVTNSRTTVKNVEVLQVPPQYKNGTKDSIQDSWSQSNHFAKQTLTHVSHVHITSIKKSVAPSATSSFIFNSPQQSSQSTSPGQEKLSPELLPLGQSPTNIYLEALKDVEVLTDAMTKDVRADEGENRVISALELLGHQGDPMFIICGYQYNNYLNKLREEMFSKQETSRPIRAFGQTIRAEHDCLIFHKQYGAIVVCIKAIGDNFKDWGASEKQKIDSTNKILEKAMKQLDREEAMIRHVTSDLHVKLACFKLIALPNMTRESVKKALKADAQLKKKITETLGHGANFFLCSDELPDKNKTLWDHDSKNFSDKLKKWWEKVRKLLTEDKNGGIEPQVYRQLIARYCGLFSTVEVWSPTNPRVEVRSASEAVSLCAQRFHKLVLLPYQIAALCSNDRRVFLYGPPGSGKTLVLVLKAREWLLAGETVILINSRPGSQNGFPYAYGVHKKLEIMMKESNIQPEKLFMLRIDSLHFNARDLSSVMPSACIIMDEVTAASHEIIEHLCSLHFNNLWCAGIFEEDKPITANSFTAHRMKNILRCPPIVQSVLKHTEQDVRPKTPYKNYYQSSVLERKNNSSSSNDGDRNSNTANKSDKEHKKYSKQYNLLYTSNNRLVNKPFYVPATHVENQNVENEINGKTVINSELLRKRLHEKYSREDQTKKEPQNTSQQEDINFCEKSLMKNNCLNCVPDGKKTKKVLSDQFNHLDNHSLESRTCKEAHTFDSDLLNKRLMETYGKRLQITEGTQVTSCIKIIDILPEKSSTRNSGLKFESDDIEKLFAENLKYDAESLNKRLAEKYSSRYQLVDELQNAGQVEDIDSLPEKSSAMNNSVKCVPEESQAVKLIAREAHCLDNQNIRSETYKEILEYDPDSVNKRLTKKYDRQPHRSEELKSAEQVIDQFYYYRSAEISLPTDGPRPYFIDHSSHKQSGNPTDCSECGQKLIEFLESMVRPENMSASSSRNKQDQNKNNYAAQLTASRSSRSGKKGSSVLFSNTSAVYTKLSAFSSGKKLGTSFDNRVLTWSDVLIVAREMPKDCAFVTMLKARKIPVEVLMSGNTSDIECTNDRKLFITSYKEVTGIERAIIVFVPSGGSDSSHQPITRADGIDLQLGHSIDRFTEEDRTVLWYVASRSLASLVLILP